MRRIEASHVYLARRAREDPHVRRRVEAMLPFIDGPPVEVVCDADLARIILEADLNEPRRHGRVGRIAPVVLLNAFRFDDPPELVQRRQADFPELFRLGNSSKFDSYGGFDWRDSGSPRHRASTGLVCQPAFALHTIVGCPFACAYCSLGWFINLFLNIESFVERLDAWLDRCPDQTLFQWDNYTDNVEFEPEYDGCRPLVGYFAGKPGRYLELYVGKSDRVDHLLGLDHRGKTTCCWSLGPRTQCARLEHGTASMDARIEAARACQRAGYPVRIRFSPIVPVVGWRREMRELIEQLFDRCRPELITMEPLRFVDYGALVRDLDVDLIDPEFVEGLRAVAHADEPWARSQFPAPLRETIYRFVIDELERVSPGTPYAFCREKRTTWDVFRDDFRRHGMDPDGYVCNCGPTSSPDHPLLARQA